MNDDDDNNNNNHSGDHSSRADHSDDPNNDHNSDDHSSNDNHSSNSDASDGSSNDSFARMKQLFLQGRSISDSLGPWTKKVVIWAEEAERIYQEERRRAEYYTTTQQQQQQLQVFYVVVGEETCKLNAIATKIRDTYEDWCKQLHQTKRMFAKGSKESAPQISQWARAKDDDECPSTSTNQSNNNNNNDDYESCDENNQDDIIQRRKARVKELFAAADKISTSLCHWTRNAVPVAYQMNDLVREVGFFSRFSEVLEYRNEVRQLYTIADEMDDLCVEWNQLLQVAKYCFALRCNENVGKNDDFSNNKCRGCGTYIGQALRQNTTLTYIHLKTQLLLLENDDADDDDIRQTMHPLIDFVQTSSSLCDVSIDGVETVISNFAGRRIFLDNGDPNLTGPVHKLTCLLFDAVRKNTHIESLHYRGFVPTSAFDNLVSTTQSLKSLELECFDPEDDALDMDALICDAFARNHTIQHLKFVPAIGDWGLAKNIFLELHNCLPKLRQLTLTCHARIYDALEPYLQHTSIEHLELLDFRFDNDRVDYLINGLKQHYFGTSKTPTITKLTFTGCTFHDLAADKVLEFMLTNISVHGVFCVLHDEETNSPCEVMLLPRLMRVATVVALRPSNHLLVGLMKAEDSIGPYQSKVNN